MKLEKMAVNQHEITLGVHRILFSELFYSASGVFVSVQINRNLRYPWIKMNRIQLRPVHTEEKPTQNPYGKFGYKFSWVILRQRPLPSALKLTLSGPFAACSLCAQFKPVPTSPPLINYFISYFSYSGI